MDHEPTRPLVTFMGAADPHGAARAAGGQWLLRCPAHEDRRASLAVRELRDGRLLLHCHAGCRTIDVLARLGLGFRDLRP